jgi:hypothetical protein
MSGVDDECQGQQARETVSFLWTAREELYRHFKQALYNVTCMWYSRSTLVVGDWKKLFNHSVLHPFNAVLLTVWYVGNKAMAEVGRDSP